MEGRDEATGHARAARRAGPRRSPLPAGGNPRGPGAAARPAAWWRHLGVMLTLAGEEGPEEELRYTGDVGDSLMGLVGSPVWSFHSSSSLVRLSLFFSCVSFSTYSWRFAFSSDSCLHGMGWGRGQATVRVAMAEKTLSPRSAGPRGAQGRGVWWVPVDLRDQAQGLKHNHHLSHPHNPLPESLCRHLISPTVPLPWVRGGAGGQWTKQKLQVVWGTLSRKDSPGELVVPTASAACPHPGPPWQQSACAATFWAVHLVACWSWSPGGWGQSGPFSSAQHPAWGPARNRCSMGVCG